MNALYPLTKQESLVAMEVSQGYSIKEIAYKNFKSEHTITNQYRAARAKTDSRNNVDLSRWVINKCAGINTDQLLKNAIRNMLVVLFVSLQAFTMVYETTDMRRPQRTKTPTAKVRRLKRTKI